MASSAATSNAPTPLKLPTEGAARAGAAVMRGFEQVLPQQIHHTSFNTAMPQGIVTDGMQQQYTVQVPNRTLTAAGQFVSARHSSVPLHPCIGPSLFTPHFGTIPTFNLGISCHHFHPAAAYVRCCPSPTSPATMYLPPYAIATILSGHSVHRSMQSETTHNTKPESISIQLLNEDKNNELETQRIRKPSTVDDTFWRSGSTETVNSIANCPMQPFQLICRKIPVEELEFIHDQKEKNQEPLKTQLEFLLEENVENIKDVGHALSNDGGIVDDDGFDLLNDYNLDDFILCFGEEKDGAQQVTENEPSYGYNRSSVPSPPTFSTIADECTDIMLPSVQRTQIHNDDEIQLHSESKRADLFDIQQVYEGFLREECDDALGSQMQTTTPGCFSTLASPLKRKGPCTSAETDDGNHQHRDDQGDVDQGHSSDVDNRPPSQGAMMMGKARYTAESNRFWWAHDKNKNNKKKQRRDDSVEKIGLVQKKPHDSNALLMPSFPSLYMRHHQTPPSPTPCPTKKSSVPSTTARGYVPPPVREESNGCTYLFSKVITQSDAGHLGRIVLPRAAAEAFLPPCDSRCGIPVTFWDKDGNSYPTTLKYWMNGRPIPKKMWVLDHCHALLSALHLRPGHVLDFFKSEGEDKYTVDVRATW